MSGATGPRAPVPAELFTVPTPGGVRGLGVGIGVVEVVGIGWAVTALHDAPGLLVATLVPLAVGALVAAVLVARVDPVRLGGVGLRRMPGRITGMLWGPGPGVEVRTSRGARIVVVVPAARELEAALSAARARHATG